MTPPRVVAIVPMRHASERVPGKNYRILGDRPLFHHIIGALLDCPRISETVIDTDSPVIREGARRSFPTVTVINRPERLRDGSIPMNDVLLHDVEQVASDFYLQTHSTNPLLRSESITAAIDRFLAAQPQHDSLFTVTRLQARLWTDDGTALNHDPRVLLRTQDLPPVYEENSCLYLFSRESLERHGNRVGERPILHELPRDQAWDIDEEIDFEVAEMLYERRERR